ncbi:MAG: glycosyltransferase [Rhodobacter sp.]|nr:glycosyltransferase [Rhodobacter sp.]
MKIVSRAAFLFVAFVLTWFGEYAYRVHNLVPSEPVAVAEGLEGQTSLDGREVTDVVMKARVQTDCGQREFGTFQATRVVSGFVPYGDATALSGLRANCSRLDAVFYEAFSIGLPGGAIRPLGEHAADFPLADFVSGWKSRNRPAAFPVLTPSVEATTAELARVLDERTSNGRFFADLEALALENVDGGLCLNLSGHPGLSAAVLEPVVRAIRAKLAAARLQTCLIGPAEAGFWEVEAISELVDRAVVLGFRAPIAPSEPVAPQGWLESQLPPVRTQLAPDRTSFALATFGEVWTSGARLPERVSFAEAMLRARAYGGETGFSADPGNTVIRYLDDRRRINQIWLADSVSFYNARQVVQGAPVVLWPLGYEDPAIWSLLGPLDDSDRVRMAIEAPISFGNHAVVEGSGPFSSIITAAVPGQRRIELSASRIRSQSFQSIPSPHRIEYFGDDGRPGRLALTFQGLGAPWAIKELLTILERRELKATFFVSTRDLLDHRETIPLLIAAGHMIGTQTEPRPSSFMLSRVWTSIRNNMAQHYLAHEYGYRTVFVQNPARHGQLPGDKTVLDQLQGLQAEGYLPVNSSLAAPFGRFDPEAFLARVNETAVVQPANVMRFDFSRQNDQETISLLPTILDSMTRAGFRIEPLEHMAGLEPNDALHVAAPDRLRRDEVTYSAIRFGWIGIQNTILLLALVVALRSPIYLSLAFLRREKYPFDEAYTPPVSVIIPAYNEAKVIESSVRSVLASDYPRLEVVVIDDGSIDETAAVVVDRFRAERRVSLWSEENHGKWFAENLGMGVSKSPIFVIVDADTLIDPGAISHLVQPFKDERVGAVAGTVEIGNRENFLTACQTIEYLVTQAVMRRAYEAFDGIIVVPGAIGAWRAEAVRKAGGVSGNTITEDADLTVAVHRAGYRVAYQPMARSFTEAPNTVRAFLRQRLRWTFGMFQVSWKHKGSILEGLPVGYISLVDAVWYGLVTSLIYPFVDLVFFASAVYWVFSFATEGTAGLTDFPVTASLGFLLLAAVDFVNVLAAFAFSRRFEWKLLPVVPLLRFGYRQLLYISSIRSILRAMVGRLSSWQKLKRSGTAAMRN